MEQIPKVIHYVWMGRAPKSELFNKCYESWKKFLPEYTIIEWNEDNFDINSNLYVKQAYENKKWAFVSDYVRLYVIYNYGGIYMDTDVEVLKPLDRFLIHSAFSGFESETDIPTGIMAGAKGNKWYKELLSYYDDKTFINDKGEMDLTTNVVVITNITVKDYGLIRNGNFQELKDGLVIYPKEYFCPLDYIKFKNNSSKITKNTYTIHHFAGSWHENSMNFRAKILSLLGENIVLKLRKIRFFLSAK